MGREGWTEGEEEEVRKNVGGGRLRIGHVGGGGGGKYIPEKGKKKQD